MDNNKRRQLTPEERAARKARIRKRRRIQRIVTGVSLLLAVIFLISTISLSARVRSLNSQASSTASRGLYEAAALARHTDPTASTQVHTNAADIVTNVDDSFFDDAVFVGDSVTLKLQQYAEDQREAGSKCLGEAQFFTAGGLGFANQLLTIENANGLHAKYNGSPTYVEDAVEAMGVTKVYVMLGMNDIGLYGVDTTVDNASQIFDKIMEQNPDVQIFVESVTPMLKSSEGTSLNNSVINEFNTKMQELCQENGYYYLDIASVVKDEDGYLKSEYCGDSDSMGMHFTDAGCQAWVDYLMANPYGTGTSTSDSTSTDTTDADSAT